MATHPHPTEDAATTAPASRVLETSCPLDCPDACSLEARVENGEVVELSAGKANPLTQGFICSKVRRFPQHMYGSERILHPGIREGAKGEGRFRTLSWDGALGRIQKEIERAIEEEGAESVLPFSYGGSNGLVSDLATDQRFFFRLGASQLARTVCAVPTTMAATGLYGKMAGVAPGDFRQSRLIVLWGVNPSATGIHQVPPVLEALRRGARLVVVDPRRIPLAKKADLHLGIRPGSDLPVALSLIRWLFETGRADESFLRQNCVEVSRLREQAEPWTFERAAAEAGVSADDLSRFAHLYAEARPALIRCGWGLERNRNGCSAAAAVLALPAVAGKFGVRGGGYTLSNTGAWDLSSASAVGARPPATRTLNMNRLGRLLQDARPPIRVLFVYNSNPLATLPRQSEVRKGLLRRGLFTVVFDQVMTDTARYADVVLPATTFLEHSDLRRGYGAMAIQPVDPVIAPVGEARSNFEVFQVLCDRMGLSRRGDARTPREFVDALCDGSPDGPSIRKQLKSNRIAFPSAGFEPIQFVDVFPKTADGKVHLFPAELDAASPPGLYAYRPDPAKRAFPLALISPATGRTVSSSFGQLHRKTIPLEIHPADADRRGLSSGDRVRVFNEHGEMHCLCQLSVDIAEGTLFFPKGAWTHSTLNGNTVNALVPDSYSDIGEGACFNDTRVEVEKL